MAPVFTATAALATSRSVSRTRTLAAVSPVAGWHCRRVENGDTQRWLENLCPRPQVSGAWTVSDLLAGRRQAAAAQAL